ncbi:hypothetical protein I7I48_01777 [Histoplasma ohiense]|nr:hypothetical protein I7I48_01777 [Histoplasma ohiense (nom. inval.)]
MWGRGETYSRLFRPTHNSASTVVGTKLNWGAFLIMNLSHLSFSPHSRRVPCRDSLSDF